MPRRKRDSGAPTRGDANLNRRYFCPADAVWGGYINLRIDPNERADFDGWQVEEGTNLSRYLAEAVVDGLKLSLTYDAENSSYIATFTGSGCGGDKARYCLSARSGELNEAINLLLYKHLVLLDGNWSSYRPATGRMDFG